MAIPMKYRKGGWDPQWWRGTEYQCHETVGVGCFRRRCFNYRDTCPAHADKPPCHCDGCGKTKSRVTPASQVIAYLRVRRGEARKEART